MKKIAFILCLLVSISTLAQKKKPTEKVKPKRVEEQGKLVAGIHAGISLSGIAYEALERDTATISYTTSVKPAVQGTLDYFLSNKVTIGFFFSVQQMKINISHWEYGDTLNPTKMHDKVAKMNRTYIGGKFLYHFKNTEKIDIYSGLRAGLLFWNNKLPSSDPLFATSLEDELLPQLNRPSIGLIPIGFRFKFTPQIAANLEINASSPHLFSFGGCYTF